MSFRLGIALLMGIISFGCASSKNAPHQSHDISPYSYGLSEAKNGVERYWVLYNTHVKAKKLGVGVDYSGVKRVDIEIPTDAKTIPLTNKNDFKDVVFYVTNKKKDFFLFELNNTSVPIEIDKAVIDKGDFSKYKALAKGKCLLTLYDNKPWVENRKGYEYGHIRKDILLIEKGHAKNSPVMPYNNPYSEPICSYYPHHIGDVIISNLSFIRTDESNFKTYLCSIKGVDGLKIKKVRIETPQNTMDSDQAIRITDCTNVTFDNLTIDGTYSRKDYSGYGVSMNNIWNFKAFKMYGHGNWGVFGTNNINVSYFDNCDINRFDIHCYGRDVRFNNVSFRNRYNSFSSVFGTILFNGCHFYDFVPVVGDASYNAHVGYDLIFKDCEYYTHHDTPQLIYDVYPNYTNTRPELKEQCLPNVTVSNFTFHINDKSPNAYLFFLKGDGINKLDMDYISNITLDGVSFQYDGSFRRPIDFIIFNVPLEVNHSVKFVYKGIDILGNTRLPALNKGKIVNKLRDNRKKTVVGKNMIINSIE